MTKVVMYWNCNKIYSLVSSQSLPLHRWQSMSLYMRLRSLLQRCQKQNRFITLWPVNMKGDGFFHSFIQDLMLHFGLIAAWRPSMINEDQNCCLFLRPEDWAPPLYDPLLFHIHGQGDLTFRMALMKGVYKLVMKHSWLSSWIYNDLITNFLIVDDFSGVATTTTFSLGTTIPIAASVDQKTHQPLILLLDECVASTTPELGLDSHIYPLITNKGYVWRQGVLFLEPLNVF